MVNRACPAVSAMFIGVVLASGALAGEPAKAPEKAPDPLAGPKVGASAKAASLVERDFDGNVRRLEISAEEAALERLTLSERERVATKGLIDERLLSIDKAVKDNVPLLLNLLGAAQSGQEREAGKYLREFVAKLKDHGFEGKLKERVAKELDPENAKAFTAMVDAYWKAIIDEAEKKEEGRGARARAAGKEIAKAIGQEITRSYQRVVGSKTRELEEFLKAINPTPEQESKIRNLSADYAQQTLGKPTPKQEREFVAKVFKELTPTQRREAVARYFGAGKKEEKE